MDHSHCFKWDASIKFPFDKFKILKIKKVNFYATNIIA